MVVIFTSIHNETSCEWLQEETKDCKFHFPLFSIIIIIISWQPSFANRCSAMFYCYLLLLLFRPRPPPTLIILANIWNINTHVNESP